MTVIDETFEKFSAPQKAELQKIRSLVHRLVPDAQEVISYGIPAFKYKDKYLIGFCAYKNHMSLFPTSGPIVALKDKLTGYRISKGTIQFTVDHPITELLIAEILQVRIADIRKSP